MGYLSKRTDQEIEHSIHILKDYTGGYKFLPWLIWMNYKFFIAVLIVTAIGIGVSIYNYEPIGIYVLMVLWVIYLLMFFWSYKRLKRGITG